MKKETKVERVQVSVRVRPFLDDVKKDPTSPIESIDKKRNVINILKEYDKKHILMTIYTLWNQINQKYLKKLQKK
jgi:hypothetical protein